MATDAQTLFLRSEDNIIIDYTITAKCIKIFGASIVIKSKIVCTDLFVEGRLATIDPEAVITTINLTVTADNVNINKAAIMARDMCTFTGNVSITGSEINLGNLVCTGDLFTNISSEIIINGNAAFNCKTKHCIMIESKSNGQRIGGPSSPSGTFHFHASTRKVGPSQQPLTKSAYMQVYGKLTITDSMEIFGSMVYCGEFDNNGIAPTVTTFIPFTSYQDSFLCGHKKFRKAIWETAPVTKIVGTPIVAKFNIAGDLVCNAKTIDITGMITAAGINLSNIASGKIGHFMDLQLPAAQPVKQCISLLDYFNGTRLHTITKPETGSETVFSEN